MKPEAQRIAIAEFCGFTDIMLPMGFHQQMSDEKSKQCGGRWRFEVPDYLNDLNAMHEAEKLLRNDQFNYTALWRHLFQVVTGKEWDGDIGYFHFEMAHATASQRAEALLRTIGKWK